MGSPQRVTAAAAAAAAAALKLLSSRGEICRFGPETNAAVVAVAAAVTLLIEAATPLLLMLPPTNCGSPDGKPKEFRRDELSPPYSADGGGSGGEGKTASDSNP